LRDRAGRAAVREFVAPLDAAIRCVSHEPIRQGVLDPEGRSLLALPLWIPLPHPRLEVELRLQHGFRVLAGAAHTTFYHYDLRIDGADLQFHWHPAGAVGFPHAHVRSTANAPSVLGNAHIPTGRTLLEHVVRFLIEEVGVVPIRDNWREVLDDGEREFVQRASWRTAPGLG